MEMPAINHHYMIMCSSSIPREGFNIGIDETSRLNLRRTSGEWIPERIAIGSEEQILFSAAAIS
jgi:hypothetical protein